MAYPQRPRWYETAQNYWSKIEGLLSHAATAQGMLGGFERIADTDAQGSIRFLARFSGGVGLDCGAGIGRVTATVLTRLFDTVDLVEQEPKFIEAAKANFAGNKQVANFYCCGLQNFTPHEGRYSLIWSQWVLGHLPDDDLVAFFIRCKKGLLPDGCIGVKENIAKTELVIDSEDSSCTRPDALLKELFNRAGLDLVAEQLQEGFPSEIFPVKMYLLKPRA